MSCTTAVMLQDRLNDIERNICDGIDFRQELNEAYALADELEAENAKLFTLLKHESEQTEKLRELCRDLYQVLWACDDSKCPYGDECDDDPDEFIPHCKFKDIMRELGVEVDDGN